MFDLFGIRRRRKEKEEIIKKAIEDLKEARKATIYPYLETKWAEYEKLGEEEKKKDEAECKKKNSVCPVCGGTTIINRFTRVQGNIEGHSRGSFSGSLLGSFGSSAGDIDGKLDTLKVNECKNCGNQWEKAEPLFRYPSDYIRDDFHPHSYSSSIGFLGRRIEGILYEGADKENPLKTYDFLKCYKDTPREVLEYLLYCWNLHENWDEDTDELVGTKIVRDKKSPEFNDDEYLFTMSDEAWRITKILIGKEE